VDVTSEDVAECCDAIDSLAKGGDLLKRVTVSSDAFGSSPLFNNQGELIGYGVCKPTTLLEVISESHLKRKHSLHSILALFTKNPATLYQFKEKGQIEKGFDADILLVSIQDNSIQLELTMAKGRVLFKRN